MDYANDREDIKDIKNSHEPTHTIHMTKEQIIARCKEKEQQLLNRYFGSLIDEAASERPETIGEYTKNLPLEIASEFRKFLKELWEEVAPEAEKGKPLVLDELELRDLLTKSERRMIDSAYEEATKLTPWERITRTNHKDVTYYKGLLQEYTRDLLFVMRNDFLEEITGQHIKNKTFGEG